MEETDILLQICREVHYDARMSSFPTSLEFFGCWIDCGFGRIAPGLGGHKKLMSLPSQIFSAMELMAGSLSKLGIRDIKLSGLESGGVIFCRDLS